MTIPRVTLAGVPITLQAGAPVQNYSPIGGSALLRLSLGDGIKMTHWRRTAISVSGSGALNPGLDGINYDEVLTLDCTSIKANSSDLPRIAIIGTHRPDVEPWGLARVDGTWKKTPCALVGGEYDITPVAGATTYQLCWMPRFQVFAEPPQVGRDSGTGVSTWSFQAEEA